jgi:hypothetical protein
MLSEWKVYPNTFLVRVGIWAMSDFSAVLSYFPLAFLRDFRLYFVMVRPRAASVGGAAGN